MPRIDQKLYTVNNVIMVKLYNNIMALIGLIEIITCGIIFYVLLGISHLCGIRPKNLANRILLRLAIAAISLAVVFYGWNSLMMPSLLGGLRLR